MPTQEEILARYVALVKALAADNAFYLSKRSRTELQTSVDFLNTLRTKPDLPPSTP